MSKSKKNKFQIIDSTDELHSFIISFTNYRSMMELIRNELVEDIGDCRGRAWCGTCFVSLEKGEFKSEIETDELYLTKEIHLKKDFKTVLRLACQIDISEKLNSTVWRVISSRELL